MDAAIAFAQLATRLKFEDLPQAAVDVTRKDILDTLGVALAGSAAEGMEGLVELAREWAGKPEASVIGHGFRAPSPEAALLNSYGAHGIEYDDAHDVAGGHPGCTVIPVAFAAAERRGGVSGKELIAAVALGVDMSCRIGLSKQESRWAGWSGTAVYGYFGATLAAARILGLDEEQTANALGIAYGQASGNFQHLVEHTMTKALEPGCAARGALFSALAAQRGLTGARRCLEGELGLFKVYYRGNYDPKQLTDELGQRFEIANLSFKPYPCCRLNHTFIDLALELSKQHQIRPEDIQEVVGYVDQEPHMEFHPVAEKQNPKTIAEAQFSIPYCVAVALIRGAVVLDDFTEAAIREPAVISLAHKVVPRLDASLHRQKSVAPARMEIVTVDATHSASIEHPYGHPDNPMTMESMVSKFRDCAAHAKRRLSEENLSHVVDMVANLEEVPDVAEVMRLVCA
ncbi:MAG: MmgE/PrpD family protein [Chloroflexi bacterium]|nr:MmgE/PrpD family protein [Chloroflexota bacterium]